MTTATTRELTPELGSMLPRIFTPPLPHHCNPPGGAEQCPCGCGLHPDTSWGFDANTFAKHVLKWKLLPYQQWLNIHALEKNDTDGGFRHKILVVLVARQQGKALGVDEDVLTTDGWKKMGDLVVGDRVYHPDGHPTAVTEAHPVMYNHPCYRVETSDGRKLTVDAEHLWTVRDIRRRPRIKGAKITDVEWETLTTQQLDERGTTTGYGGYTYRLPAQQRLINKPADLPIDPYLLGAWLGDGNKRDATLNIGAKDVDPIQKNLEKIGVTITNKTFHNNCWRLGFSTGKPGQFTTAARELGVLNNKHIPESYLLAGTEQRAALFAGLLDTDGHITTSGNASYGTVNEHLADQVMYLGRSLGYRCHKQTQPTTSPWTKSPYQYSVFFTPTADPFRLPRHSRRVRPPSRIDRESISISKLEKVASVPVRCIKVDRNDGLFLAGRDLVPTHNTTWLRQLGMWRLFVNSRGFATRESPGARLILIAAQNLKYAEGVLKEVVDEIRDNGALSRELVNFRVTNGGHHAVLTGRRYWRAATASRKGGRSLTVDVAMLDELREHVTTDAWDAIAPTTVVRPFSQIVCTSNAGDARSIVLRDLRDGALRKITANDTAETTTGLFEWSIPEDVDPRDDKYWHMANPALGHLPGFKLADLRGMYEAMQYRNLPGFMTEMLCSWVDALKPGIIPAEHWKWTTDKTSRRAPGSTVYAGLDVNYERSRAFVAVAARRDDGALHVEVVQAARGTDWIIPWLLERKKTWLSSVAVQKTGAPASGMIDDLRRAGINVVEWGPGQEVTGYTGAFYDQICEHTIFHRPAPVLDRAAASGVSRNVGEGFVFDRRNSPVDVSPLIACVAAAWLEHQPNVGAPMVHAWPDEDTMRDWDLQGATAFQQPPATLNEIEGTTWWTR